MQTVYLVISFLLGLVFGSFVTMASYRIPRGEDIFIKRSYCTNCHHKLGIIDLFPLFSFLLFNGRCHYCKVNISARYPIIELITAILFVTSLLVTNDIFIIINIWLIIVVLMIISVIDLEHYIIPDSLQISLLILAIIFAKFNHYDLIQTIINFFVTFAIGLIFHYGYKLIRKKEGLGFGDVKFFAVAGLFMPLTMFPTFLFIAGIIGTICGLSWQKLGRGQLFPFAPALCISLLFCIYKIML